MQGEPGLLCAEQAGRLNETDEERRSVECRPAWADWEARTMFYGPAPMPGGGDLWPTGRVARCGWAGRLNIMCLYINYIA